MREAEGVTMDEMTRRMAVSTISLTGMGVAMGEGVGGGRERRLGLAMSLKSMVSVTTMGRP